MRWNDDHEDVVGVDINLSRLRKASTRVSVVRCDGRLLPFCQSVFLSVACYSVLEHMKDYPKSLYEMTRVLAKGGVCSILQPVDNDPLFIIGRRLVRHWHGDAIISRFTSGQ